MTFWENLHDMEASASLSFTPYKYRCEQVVTTKINEIPVSTVQLKTDYFVEKIMERQENMAFHFRMDDNISTMFPSQYTQAMEMMNDLEQIKCNVTVSVNPQTGDIGRVLDSSDVSSRWEKFKSELTRRYKFLRGQDARKGLKALISAMDESMSTPALHLAELRSKVFFSTFFGKYLVGEDNYESSSEMNFKSQLFDGVEFNLLTTRRIENESERLVTLSHKGEAPESMHLNKDIKKLYERIYMPDIRYKFSEYHAEYEASLDINTDINMLEKAHIYLSEEVVNNIMFTVNCDIRKIE